MTALFVNIQTRASHPELWELPEPPDGGFDKPEDLLKGTVNSIKAYLKTYGILLAREEIASSTEGEPGIPYLAALTQEELSGKDRGGVHDAIAQAASALDNLQKRYALTGETAEVIAFSYYASDEKKGAVSGALNHKEHLTEVALLSKFIALMSRHSPLVMWNGGFTLNVLWSRIAYHGLQMPKLLDTRPWGHDIIDVLKARSSGKGLKWHAAALGIKDPHPDIDGGAIAMLYETHPRMVLEYSKGSVYLLREVYKRWGASNVYVRDLRTQEQIEAELKTGLPEPLKKGGLEA